MSISDEAVNIFIKKHKIHVFRRKKVIIKPDEDLSLVYFLSKGLVKQYSISPEGNEITFHIFQPGTFFPLMLILAGKINRYYFETIEDSTVFPIPREEMISFINANPGVLLDFSKRLSRGLTGILSRMENLMFDDTKTRIASLLVYFSKHFGENAYGATRIQIPLAHKEIATWVGVSRETVSRQMNQLKINKLLNYHGQFITILDSHKLEKLSTTTSKSKSSSFGQMYQTK